MKRSLRRVGKMVDPCKELREENERLEAELKHSRVQRLAIDGQAIDLQARLSAAEDKNVTLALEVNSVNQVCEGLEQKNERLRARIGEEAVAHRDEHGIVTLEQPVPRTVLMSGVLLQQMVDESTDLQARLSAAEDALKRRSASALALDAQLQRAEAVVEAAKKHECVTARYDADEGHYAAVGDDEELRAAIRRYEGEKKDVTPGPISDR